MSAEAVPPPNRSWLFVPGDSERKLEKARENPADALILDFEDAVADARQEIARRTVCEYLCEHADRGRQQLWVRVNPLESELSLPDLVAVLPGRPDGIVLPKTYGAGEVNTLCSYLTALEVREGLPGGSTRILGFLIGCLAPANACRYSTAACPRDEKAAISLSIQSFRLSFLTCSL